MINRELYMNKLWAYKDTEFIKVITGIRRCGKSSLLKLLMNKLLEENEKLQSQCEHEYENGYCIYCYKQKED